MALQSNAFNRRKFIKKSSLFTFGALGTGALYAAPDLMPLNSFTQEDDFNIIGPKEGYTPENTFIISWRANRIKNDGTAREHQLIMEWMSTP
jgi:hypothetical protein